MALAQHPERTSPGTHAFIKLAATRTKPIELVLQAAAGLGLLALAARGYYRSDPAPKPAREPPEVQVAIVRGFPVFKVTGTRIFTNGNKSIRDDNRYLKLLKLGLDPSGAAQGLFFSYNTNLSLSEQRIHEQNADNPTRPAWQQADSRFFWNRHLAKPFTESEGPGVGKFIVPLIMGSLQQLPDLQLPGSRFMTVTLIARRAVQRPGVRHWRRGADPQGAVANQVETEQLVQVRGTEGSLTSSFVQLRGSIPLMWSQVPNIKYKPATQVAPLEDSEHAFDAHVQGLLKSYESVVAINLANQHGSEGLLGKAFIRENTRFAGSTSGLRLVSFDFHKVCGSKHYERMDLLWKEVVQDFDKFAWWEEKEGGAKPRRQCGVLRTNCIDCLDRTNVVQGFFARHQLEAVLRGAGVLGPGGSLPADLPAVEAKFKVMWANHGDDISLQYAGTGALKSGFTRTGKRTYGGLVDDGVKSLTRYCLNNFTDGRKQDALDLVTGTYVVDKSKPSPFKVQASPLLLVTIAVIAVLFALRSLLVLLLGRTGGEGVIGVSAALLQQVVLPLGLAFLIMRAIAANGRRLVNRPQLCPRLAHPWADDAAVDPGGAKKH
ncbi:hypothetical protein WJX73_003446 [Symbiochloris irregularis]|uniref:SAC domain-containing protein n=1 Tax=Symbiochloris irregularis TaxID=706552 RepID=A0AAW1P773_9CHLO